MYYKDKYLKYKLKGFKFKKTNGGSSLTQKQID